METATCIANSDTTKGPEVPLWECPCRECWELEQDVCSTLPEARQLGLIESYKEWREARS